MILDTKKISKLFELTYFHTAFNNHWSDGFAFAGESHDFWEMVCVISGSVLATEDSKIYTLNASDVIFHAPLEFHSIKCIDINAHVLIVSFSIDGTLPENLSDGVFSLTVDEINALKKIFEKIYTFIHDSDSTAVLSTECFYEYSSYILSLSKNHKTKDRILSSHSAKEFNSIVTYMNKTVCDNLSVTDFAKATNISVSKLKVLFNKFAGISPKAYYSKLRCNEVMRLLCEGYSSVEISNLMNFSSPNYLSSFFKSHTGITPTEYLNTL